MIEVGIPPVFFINVKTRILTFRTLRSDIFEKFLKGTERNH